MNESPANQEVDALAEYQDQDDFVRLTFVGEQVRRVAALLETVPADVAALLAVYEAALTAFNGPIPSTLAEDAMGIAADLTAYQASDDEDGDAALSLILQLDAVVSVVVAAERSNRLPHGTTLVLASRLEQALVGVSWRSPNLAQLAEDRWLTVGDDPDITGAYGWLDILAEAAPSRARLAAVVKRESRIANAMEILGKISA